MSENLSSEYDEALRRVCVKDDSERDNPFTAVKTPVLIALSKCITHYVENCEVTDENREDYSLISTIAIEAGELFFRAMHDDMAVDAIGEVIEGLEGLLQQEGN